MFCHLRRKDKEQRVVREAKGECGCDGNAKRGKTWDGVETLH